MSTTVIGRNDLGLTIETFDENGVIDPNKGVIAVAVGISPITELPGSTNAQEALQALATGAGSGGVSPVDLASTAAGKGASMVGIQDAGGRYTGTTVEAALVEAATVAALASTANANGASLVGIEDSFARYVGTTVEAALGEVTTIFNLAGQSNGQGASLVGIEDTGSHYTGVTVEAALAEAAVATNAAQATADAATVAADLASTANAKGASLVGIEDAGVHYTGTTVEAALSEAAVATAAAQTTANAATVAADLSSTANLKGASLVGIEDTGAHFTGTTVEAALSEIGTALASTVTPLFLDEKLRARFVSLNPSGTPGRDFDDLEIQAQNENADDSHWRLANGAQRTNEHGSSVKCVGSGPAGTVMLAKGLTAIATSLRSVKWLLGGAAWIHDAVDPLDDHRAFHFVSNPNTFANVAAVGIFADASTTKFVFRLKGDANVDVLSTVNISLGLHFFELWYDGTSVFGSVDFETPVLVSSTMTDIPDGAVQQWHGAQSGTTTIYIDAVGTYFERS